MSVPLFRRLIALLIVSAYLGATMVSAATTAAPAHAVMGGMMANSDMPGDKMPCKGKLDGCITDIGCIFLVSVLSPDLGLVTVSAWSSIIYAGRTNILHGLSLKPALGPPILA
jgi:hypothetical protein